MVINEITILPGVNKFGKKEDFKEKEKW